jgi:hypothetical protein
LHFNRHRWHRVALADVGAGFPVQVIPDGTGGLWIPFGFIFKSFKMLHYVGGQLQPVALPVPRGTVLQVAAATAVPGRPQAIAVGGTWPALGPIGGYTRALILAYRLGDTPPVAVAGSCPTQGRRTASRPGHPDPPAYDATAGPHAPGW